MTSATGPGRLSAWRERRPRATVPWILAGVAFAAALVALLLLLARESQDGAGETLPSAVALFQFLNREPFILLFLTMAGGYSLGKLAIKGLSLGPTAGSLVVAIGLSVWASGRHGIHFELPPFASVIFFNLFMFAIGMKVGPQFIAGLGRGAKNYLILAAFVPLSGLALVLVLGALRPPAGVLVGLFTGANTATPGLAAAEAAFASGAVTLPVGVEQSVAIENMNTAFACSYCLSAVLFVVFLKALPGLFRRDPSEAARAFEREVGGGGAPLPGAGTSFWPGAIPLQQRTFRIEQTLTVDKTLGELRAEQPFIVVEHLARAGESVPLVDETRLQTNDQISVLGRVPLLIDAARSLGPEVHDPSVPQPDLQTVEVVQQNPSVIGRRLVDLAKDVGHGIHLNAMFHGGEEVPRGNDVTVSKGDVLRVSGSPERLGRLETEFGPVVRPSLSTDILTLALGLCTGSVLGAISVPIGRIDFTLGSIALLLVGIAFSTLRTRNPALGGPFPEPARQLLEDLGLNVFVVMLGLNSGAGVMRAIAEGALAPILVGTLLVGLVPALLAWALGLFVLKMNTAELLGAVAGARCASSALKSAQEVCGSTVPAVAYPVTYAVASLLLTLVSYLLVLLE